MSERLRPPLTAPPAEWAKPDIVFNPLRLPPLPPVADATLLEQALTHKSSLTGTHVADPDPNVRERVEFDCNRRLEWAGDALFTWLVTEELFVRFPSATAGDLSVRASARLVGQNAETHAKSPLISADPSPAPHLEPHHLASCLGVRLWLGSTMLAR